MFEYLIYFIFWNRVQEKSVWNHLGMKIQSRQTAVINVGRHLWKEKVIILVTRLIFDPINHSLISGIIQANKTLLVICIVVFVIFLSILFCVVFLFGRSKLQKRNFITREKKISSNTKAVIIKEENKLPPIPGDFAFVKRVLPHIIKFPTKEWIKMRCMKLNPIFTFCLKYCQFILLY